MFTATLECLLRALAELAVRRFAVGLALVIGNCQYRHIKPRKSARNDARLMADTLSAGGLEVVGNVRENLNRAYMWRAGIQFRSRNGKGDEVVFFFSGHGVQVGAHQMLLPVDIDADSADQVETDAIRLLDVHDYFREAGLAVVVIDDCRDNPFPPRPGLRSLGEAPGLMRPARDHLAMGSVPGSTASDGLFTRESVQSLTTPGLDVVTALRQARDRVEDRARRANHEQRPALAEEMRGQFVLFSASAPAAPAAPVATEASPISLADEA